MKVRLSLDSQSYSSKPKGNEIMAINNRIANKKVTMELQELAVKIGEEGHTFCQTIFSGWKRKITGFQEMQILALDFDCGVPYKEIKTRAEEYCLPIAFAYSTFSSTESNPKFRVVFVNDVVITDPWVANIMTHMLYQIFEEADKSCKDLSRMFFGGAGLIGDVREDTINIVQLTESFQRTIFEKGEKNYARAIQRFAKMHNISCVNNVLQIKCVHNDGKTEGENAADPYIYTSVTEFPSGCPLYAIFRGYQPHVRKNQDGNRKVRAERSVIAQKCQLYCDFKNLPHIHHNLRFMLLTNMIQIQGGKKIFLSIIEKKNYNNNKWRFFWKYAQDNGYKPQSCMENCLYAEKCHHKTNMVLTVKEKEQIIKKDEDIEYHSLEEVFNCISIFLEDAINQRPKGVYLIPAQTAVGKTEVYCRLIRLYEQRRFIVAVPTNQLKREVEERLKSIGIQDILVTPSIDEAELPEELKAEIKWLYQLGVGRKVADAIRVFVKNNKNSQEMEVIQAVEWSREYLRVEKELPNKRVIVTTHARLVTLTEDIIKNCQVIVDEDILSTFFKNIRLVSLSALENALEIESIPVGLEERIKQLLAAKEGRYEKFETGIDYGYIPKSELEKKGISEDINGIAFASVFQKEGEYIRYFYPQMMQPGRYIILSATINETLYQRYFTRWYVKTYPYYRAEYRGKLTQLTAFSMSRQCICDNLDRLIKFIRQYGNGYEIITFQRYEELFDTGGIHFGNAEGVDRLKGKNIIVIGTPHQNEFVYKLIGCYLGMAVNEDTLAVRKVRSGGYEFNLMTYKGEDLRELQMYYIRKDLEQCIGRARLLRQDCEVLVLSNFPCEQAKLNQEDYLGAMESADSESVRS